MRTSFCILGCALWGISAPAQTLVGTLGAASIASGLQGIGSNAAAIGLNAANNLSNNLQNGAANGTPTARPATTAPTTRPATTAPTTRPSTGNTGGTTGGTTGGATGGATGGTNGGTNGGGAGQGSTPRPAGGYSARYVNNGYGRGVSSLGGGTSAGPVFGGRTLSAPLRPVFARITNMRQARLNLRLGFANLVSAPSAGVGAQ